MKTKTAATKQSAAAKRSAVSKSLRELVTDWERMAINGWNDFKTWKREDPTGFHMVARAKRALAQAE